MWSPAIPNSPKYVTSTFPPDWLRRGPGPASPTRLFLAQPLHVTSSFTSVTELPRLCGEFWTTSFFPPCNLTNVATCIAHKVAFFHVLHTRTPMFIFIAYGFACIQRGFVWRPRPTSCPMETFQVTVTSRGRRKGDGHHGSWFWVSSSLARWGSHRSVGVSELLSGFAR